MAEFWQSIQVNFVAFLFHLVIAAVVVFAGMKLVDKLDEKLDSLPPNKMDRSLSGYIKGTVLIILRMGLLVTAALIIGIPGSAFITVFGSAGVAIGLAMQGSLSNLAGGLMLMFFRPFNVGDYIKSSDYEGTVSQISAFYTSILTPDRKHIVLPNGALSNEPIVNYSREAIRLIELPFAVAYNTDPDRVRNVMLETCANEKRTLLTPGAAVFVTALTDSAVTYTLRVWVKNQDYLLTSFALRENIMKALHEHNIHIPFPQMDVHVTNNETAEY